MPSLSTVLKRVRWGNLATLVGVGVVVVLVALGPGMGSTPQVPDGRVQSSVTAATVAPDAPTDLNRTTADPAPPRDAAADTPAAARRTTKEDHVKSKSPSRVHRRARPTTPHRDRRRRPRKRAKPLPSPRAAPGRRTVRAATPAPAPVPPVQPSTHPVPRPAPVPTPPPAATAHAPAASSGRAADEFGPG